MTGARQGIKKLNNSFQWLSVGEKKNHFNENDYDDDRKQNN